MSTVRLCWCSKPWRKSFNYNREKKPKLKKKCSDVILKLLRRMSIHGSLQLALRSFLDEMKELRDDLFVRRFAVEIRDEIVSSSNDEKQSIHEDDDDNGIATTQARHLKWISFFSFRPSSMVTSARHTVDRRVGGAQRRKQFCVAF